jgi:hypothetical protein
MEQTDVANIVDQEILWMYVDAQGRAMKEGFGDTHRYGSNARGSYTASSRRSSKWIPLVCKMTSQLWQYKMKKSIGDKVRATV